MLEMGQLRETESQREMPSNLQGVLYSQQEHWGVLYFEQLRHAQSMCYYEVVFLFRPKEPFGFLLISTLNLRLWLSHIITPSGICPLNCASEDLSPIFLQQSLDHTGKAYYLFESDKPVLLYVKDSTKVKYYVPVRTKHIKKKF